MSDWHDEFTEPMHDTPEDKGQLQPDEKGLCALTGLVLDKLSSMTDKEFQRLDLFGETG